MKKSLNILLAIAILAQAVPVAAGIDQSISKLFGSLGWYENNITTTAKAKVDLDVAEQVWFAAVEATYAEAAYAKDAYAEAVYAEDVAQAAYVAARITLENANNEKLKSSAWAYRLVAGGVSVAILGGIAVIVYAIVNKESRLRKLTNKLIAKLKKNNEQAVNPTVSSTN